METVDFNGLKLRRWTFGPSTFLAHPEMGARLMNWNIRMSDGAVRDVIHWPENADFEKFPKIRGGNPILFPFAARTFDQGKIGFWRDQSGTVRPMPTHGFARDGIFELVELTDSGFTAELKPSEAAKEIYPFDYTFSVQYVFNTIGLQVYLTLENKGSSPILWSAGHHFYFALPWHEGFTHADYRFEIPAKKCFMHASDGALVPVKPFENAGSFGNAENSDRIFTKLTGFEAKFGPKGGEEDVSVRILSDPQAFPESLASSTVVASPWNGFVIWREHAESPFYCVEPWMGPPNSPEHGKGLHAVNPRDRATFGVEVALV